jgi:GNAT superfamily N-acetyltransferase
VSIADVSHLVPTEINPRTASREWWQRYHAYRQFRHVEVHPEDPFVPDEINEAWNMRDDPLHYRRIYCIDDGKQVVSTLLAFADQPGTPEYEGNKHLLRVEGDVLKEFRRRGLGSRWAPTVLGLMNEYGSTVLTISSEEDDGHGFLKRLGADARLRQRENRLDFTRLDWKMLGQWIHEGEQRNPETKLIMYENRVPADVLPAFCLALTEMVNLAPMEDMDHGGEVITPETAEEHFSQLAVMKGVQHTYITKEPGGAISGITGIVHVPFEGNRIRQGFTGVGMAFRGRGLGKWMKAAMLQYVHGRFPDTKWITTGNANSNEPMLAINHKLGFRLHRESVTYQISKEKLEAAAAGVAAS